MKNIRSINIDLDKYSKNVINNLAKAQRNTAEDIWEYLFENANMDTGTFISSIEIEDTQITEDSIKTFIGSDLKVVDSNGQSYNLGFLLENGTMPHTIVPVNGEYLVFEKDGKTIFTKLVHHPGMRAYNNYKNALNSNIRAYKANIKKAMRDSL